MKHDFSLSTLRCKVCGTSATSSIDRDLPCQGQPAPEQPISYAWMFVAPAPKSPDPRPFNLGEEISFQKLQAATRKMRISCN